MGKLGHGVGMGRAWRSGSWGSAATEDEARCDLGSKAAEMRGGEQASILSGILPQGMYSSGSAL